MFGEWTIEGWARSLRWFHHDFLKRGMLTGARGPMGFVRRRVTAHVGFLTVPVLNTKFSLPVG